MKSQETTLRLRQNLCHLNDIFHMYFFKENIAIFLFTFHWNVSHRIQLMVSQHWFCWWFGDHYDDVIMSAIASQITSLTVVYSTVYWGADQRKHQSSALLAFVWGIHRDRWIPRTKGQLRGKCFHLMTSSCKPLSEAKVIQFTDTHASLRPNVLTCLCSNGWSCGVPETYKSRPKYMWLYRAFQ